MKMYLFTITDNCNDIIKRIRVYDDSENDALVKEIEKIQLNLERGIIKNYDFKTVAPYRMLVSDIFKYMDCDQFEKYIRLINKESNDTKIDEKTQSMILSNISNTIVNGHTSGDVYFNNEIHSWTLTID